MDLFDTTVLAEFDTHTQRLRESARRRREQVTLRNPVEDAAEEAATDIRSTFGVPQAGEQMAGDTAIRTLFALLDIIDNNGFERSAHQQMFHSAMIRAVARVLYRADWAVARPEIMKRHGWTKAPSEVLVSTPRRFGKTFSCARHRARLLGWRCRSSPCLRRARSIAILVACLALSCKCEVVIFSPARRASRKILERIHEQPKRFEPARQHA